MTQRDQALQDIADDVRHLTKEVRLTSRVDRCPGGHRSNATVETICTIHAGLLFQLVENLAPGSPGADVGFGGRPGSRPPSSAAASIALSDLHNGWPLQGGFSFAVGIIDLRAELREETGKRWAGSRPLVPMLHEIRALAHEVPEKRVLEVAKATSRWVKRARVALAYEAPLVKLRDVVCPHCGCELLVANDASTDVWCSNEECRDEEDRRRTWPRRNWVFLLEQIGSPA